MRIAFWDIETWDLNAPFGPLVCASVLLTEPGFEDRMITLRQDEYVRQGIAEDMVDDRQLCIDLRDLLEEQNMTVGYFSKGFDIPHLRSRLALHGERALAPHFHFDPIWAFKGWRGLKFGSASMKNVAAHLGLEQKPAVSSEVWMSAKAGRKAAMDEVCERCEADVRITREITQYVWDHKLLKNIQMYP